MDVAPSPEIAWLSQFTEFAKAAGPYGVIAALGLVVRTLWGEVKARDTVIASLQEKRAEETGRSAERLATVATTGSAAIVANTTAISTHSERAQEVLDMVRPMSGEHARIMTMLDRNAAKIDEAVAKAGTGCRA